MTSKSNGMRAALGSGLVAAVLLLGGCAEEPAGTAASSAAIVVACSPVAAHPKHAGASCATCHLCLGAGEDANGGVVFNPAGLAFAAGQPAPVFDKTTKTCANVACHGVAAGTFSYYSVGGDGEPVLNTVAYGGAALATPSWLSTGTGMQCDGCHGNPPRNGGWHSGYHAGQGPAGAANQCQFCHPDATSTNGVGTAITNASLHGNRLVEVTPRFRSSCFGCH